MPPLFSIITPTYQALAKLGDSFESVAGQTPGLFEYLIIDGASSDGTRAWLEGKRSDSVRWLSEPDAGVYDAMNKGIRMARGQFLIFLGAGDRLAPGILESAARFIGGLPTRSPRLVYGNVRMMAEGGRVRYGRLSPQKLCAQNICHQAIFYERSIFELLGGYELKYPIYADWAFNLRCFGDRRIAIHFWEQVVADFDGGGLSDRVADVPFAQDRVALIRRNLGWLPAIRFRFEQKLQRGFDRIRRPTH